MIDGVYHVKKNDGEDIGVVTVISDYVTFNGYYNNQGNFVKDAEPSSYPLKEIRSCDFAPVSDPGNTVYSIE